MVAPMRVDGKSCSGPMGRCAQTSAGESGIRRRLGVAMRPQTSHGANRKHQQRPEPSDFPLVSAGSASAHLPSMRGSNSSSGSDATTTCQSGTNSSRSSQCGGPRARAKNLKKERGLVKQGQAIIWAANTYHGGEPVLDKSRTRHSQVTHYYFENCTYYTPYFSDPFLGNVFFRRIIDIKTNQRVRNTYCGRDDIEYVNPEPSAPSSPKRGFLGRVIARLWN
jgi:hypothetical protein